MQSGQLALKGRWPQCAKITYKTTQQQLKEPGKNETMTNKNRRRKREGAAPPNNLRGGGGATYPLPPPPPPPPQIIHPPFPSISM